MVDLKITLPNGFLDEEVRDGYTVSRHMKEVWAVELDLLAEFCRVCDKYGLKYFADGGTLLGCVRHQGFIPWDDDIDIVMMRDDYERLCEIATTEFKNPYFFQTEYTDKASFRCHAQLRNSSTTGILKCEYQHKYSFNQGIFIDIFPMDAIPDDDAVFHKQMENVERLKMKGFYKMTFADRFKPSENRYNHVFKCVLRKILMNSWLYYLVDPSIAMRKLEKELCKYNGINTCRVGKLFFLYAEKRIWHRIDFVNVEYMRFEMLKLPVPVGYRRVLTTFYGKDWETPVKSCTTHGGCVYDVSKSYKEYI